MAASRRRLAAVIACPMLIAGCGGGEERARVPSGPASTKDEPGTARPAEATRRTRCEVGGRPDYFVPKPEEARIAIVGCARLGVSGKPVEFSANSEPMRGTTSVCLHPAYRENGRLGNYIPAVCVREPLPRRPYVLGIEGPREVQGYAVAVWGTAAPSTRQVVAHYEGGRTSAAVFTVRRQLARAVGAIRAFSVFVVELHPEAVCGPVLLRATGTSAPRTTRIGARPKLCS